MNKGMIVYKKLNCTKWWQVEFLEKNFFKGWQKRIFYHLKGFLVLFTVLACNKLLIFLVLRVYRTIFVFNDFVKGPA